MLGGGRRRTRNCARLATLASGLLRAISACKFARDWWRLCAGLGGRGGSSSLAARRVERGLRIGAERGRRCGF
jgi:hypothetical protein